MKKEVMKSEKEFDLNIEEILEDWEIYHGIREIISNSLDEQILSNSADIQIKQTDNNRWNIRDFGRGLHYTHLTMKENNEKISHPRTIGKFGIGLKDALATFHRNRVECEIHSKYHTITVERTKKHGFDDILTLHARLTSPVFPDMHGTKVVLIGVSEEDIKKAKGLFLRFSDDKTIEQTDLGEVLKHPKGPANIYINGIKVAEEENFLFSYNITSLTSQISKALNRERSNVGRTAYTSRVKSILVKCQKKKVLNELVSDLQKYDEGTIHDELLWVDVQEHAVKVFNTQEKVVFVTTEEIIENPDAIDEARSAGYKIINIPERLRDKISGMKDLHGNQIRDFNQFNREYQDSYEYEFININELSPQEQEIFEKKQQIINLVGQPKGLKSVRISATIKKDFTTFTDANGVYEPLEGLIIIKRNQLRSLDKFVGTLLHEIAHASSGVGDVDRRFEIELTHFLGKISNKVL